MSSLDREALTALRRRAQPRGPAGRLLPFLLEREPTGVDHAQLRAADHHPLLRRLRDGGRAATGASALSGAAGGAGCTVRPRPTRRCSNPVGKTTRFQWPGWAADGTTAPSAPIAVSRLASSCGAVREPVSSSTVTPSSARAAASRRSTTGRSSTATDQRRRRSSAGSIAPPVAARHSGPRRRLVEGRVERPRIAGPMPACGSRSGCRWREGRGSDPGLPEHTPAEGAEERGQTMSPAP